MINEPNLPLHKEAKCETLKANPFVFKNKSLSKNNADEKERKRAKSEQPGCHSERETITLVPKSFDKSKSLQQNQESLICNLSTNLYVNKWDSNANNGRNVKKNARNLMTASDNEETLAEILLDEKVKMRSTKTKFGNMKKLTEVKHSKECIDKKRKTSIEGKNINVKNFPEVKKKGKEKTNDKILLDVINGVNLLMNASNTLEKRRKGPPEVEKQGELRKKKTVESSEKNHALDKNQNHANLNENKPMCLKPNKNRIAENSVVNASRVEKASKVEYRKIQLRKAIAKITASKLAGTPSTCTCTSSHTPEKNSPIVESEATAAVGLRVGQRCLSTPSLGTKTIEYNGSVLDSSEFLMYAETHLVDLEQRPAPALKTILSNIAKYETIIGNPPPVSLDSGSHSEVIEDLYSNLKSGLSVLECINLSKASNSLANEIEAIDYHKALVTYSGVNEQNCVMDLMEVVLNSFVGCTSVPTFVDIVLCGRHSTDTLKDNICLVRLITSDFHRLPCIYYNDGLESYQRFYEKISQLSKVNALTCKSEIVIHLANTHERLNACISTPDVQRDEIKYEESEKTSIADIIFPAPKEFQDEDPHESANSVYNTIDCLDRTESQSSFPITFGHLGKKHRWKSSQDSSLTTLTANPKDLQTAEISKGSTMSKSDDTNSSSQQQLQKIFSKFLSSAAHKYRHMKQCKPSFMVETIPQEVKVEKQPPQTSSKKTQQQVTTKVVKRSSSISRKARKLLSRSKSNHNAFTAFST